MRAFSSLALTLLLASSAHAQPIVPTPDTPTPDAPTPDAPTPRAPSPTRTALEGLAPLEATETLEIGGGSPLTLGQVLSSVERHHPAIEGARQDLRAAEGEQLAAQGGFDLGLTARGWASPEGYYDWGRADVRLDQPTPLWGAHVYAGWRIGRGGDIPDYYGNYETLDLGEVRAGLRIPLWRGGPIDSRRARMWRAAHATTAQQAQLDARMLQLRIDAATKYWSWVAAGLSYRIAVELLGLAEARNAQIRARVDAGALPEIEALENRRAVLARRVSLVSARRSLERAAIGLSLYFRGDDGRPRTALARRVPLDRAPPAPLRVDLDRAIAGATDRRPELTRYAALIRRQRVSVDLAENQFAPQIDVTVGASVDLGAGTDDEQRVLGPPVVEGSIVLSLPFQFREARGGIRRTQAELAGLRADEQLVRDRIATQVRDAHSAHVAARERLALAEEAAQVATAIAAAEQRRFDLGASQLLIVNLREQAAAAAQRVVVEAEMALHIAEWRWRTVIAEGSPSSSAP